MTQLYKQPVALYGLSFTAIFERFAYYAVNCTLVLFLMHHFAFTKAQSYDLFAAFTAFMYLMTPVGGYCADYYLGVNGAIVLGMILLGVGYSIMAIAGHLSLFYLGLATIAVGNGFFQPMIAVAVGRLYGDSDHRRDRGFLWFYAAINIGAVLPPLMVAWLFKQSHWQMVYSISAIFVFLSVLVFYFQRNSVYQGLFFQLRDLLSVLCFVFFSTAIIDFSLQHTQMTNACLIVVALIFIGYVMVKAARFSGGVRVNLLTCSLLVVFSILFWALYQQKAMSLLIFSQRYVDRSLFHYQIMPVVFLALNPLLIVLLTPVMSRCLMWLEKRERLPSVVQQFALGTILMGAGFLVFPLVGDLFSVSGKLPMSWLLCSYTLITCGELCLSPIGLSMITTYAPESMRGVMMGLWYLGSSAAFALSGFISDWTIPSVQVSHPVYTQFTYLHVFMILGLVAFLLGALLWFFSPRLQFDQAALKQLSHVPANVVVN